VNLNLSAFWTLVVLVVAAPVLTVLIALAVLIVGGGFPEM
jgi:hypothetical protein